MKRMKTTLVKSFIICFVLLCLISSASAYTTQYEWPNSHVGYTIHSSIPSSFNSPVNAAASAWSNANADFDYFLSVNSNNLVKYVSLGSSSSTLATCTSTHVGDSLTKIEIKINSDKSWSTSSSCPSGYFDVQGVMTHEFGHGVGLGHSSDSGATMYPYISSGQSSERSLESDDISGIIAIYGFA